MVLNAQRFLRMIVIAIVVVAIWQIQGRVHGVPNTEDEDGNPVYDWTIIDRIFDTYVERGERPLVEIGFMPQALSTKQEPYRHNWQPGDPYSDIFTGWEYPPNDYDKWAELVFQWVLHSVDRYGAKEVNTWY